MIDNQKMEIDKTRSSKAEKIKILIKKLEIKLKIELEKKDTYENENNCFVQKLD